jgi:hypothetical protein
MFAGTAHAGHVSWSIGIEAPIGPGATIGTVISNHHAAPVPMPAPVMVAPAPVIYAPPPVVYRPAPVVYAPPVVYGPAPVVYAAPPVYVPRRVVAAPVWVGGRWVHAEPRRHHRHHHHGRDHRDGWRDGRGHWDDDRRGPPVHEPQGGWRRDPR